MNKHVDANQGNVMTYKELSSAINDYFNAPMSDENFILSIFLVVCLTIFVVWFPIYLYRTLKKEKSQTDEFQVRFKDKLNFMGFNRDKKDSGETKKDENKGGINDEY